MTIEICRLMAANEADYSDLLQNAPEAMLYHSLKYRAFLNAFLKDVEDHYLLAYDKGRLVAALPAFIKNGPLGVVVNSLPFYGSHGSIISKSQTASEVKRLLLMAFDQLCRSVNAICSTIIETPSPKGLFLQKDYPADYIDERIGQITLLPSYGSEQEVVGRLFSLFHQKTRNMIRKGIKAGFSISHDGSEATLQAIHKLHYENIRVISGLPKPWEVFKAIEATFEYDRDYRVYTSTNREGEIISALLLFYFKEWVEYFTPATLEAYRPQQPLSALIYTAMKDAVIERQSRYWNWGGTWLSQDGVYRFKSRWGTTDIPYRYFIKEYLEHVRLREYNQEQLMAFYPYFYTIPFSAVREAESPSCKKGWMRELRK